MNPVLKYRGGKSREIPRFLQYIPDDFNRYIEPFFGGGAVYFHLEPENAIINDDNEQIDDLLFSVARSISAYASAVG